MRLTLTRSLIICCVLLLSACSSVNLGNKVPIEDRDASNQIGGSTASDTAAGAIGARTVETVTIPAAQSKNDATDIPVKRSIYFDYDSYSIKNEYQSLIEVHAKYLTSKTNQKIIIQGNTDERGGREYNLALGQKRAEIVRKSLTLLNVPEAQIEAVSFGKEKPKATASNEAAWAENRRADITYK